MKPSLATTSSILAAAVAVVATASIAAKPAAAAPKITLGTLKCKGHGGVGLILGSKERMHCVFTTAVSAMCLEIYYRYLPLYEGAKRTGENP